MSVTSVPGSGTTMMPLIQSMRAVVDVENAAAGESCRVGRTRAGP